MCDDDRRVDSCAEKVLFVTEVLGPNLSSVVGSENYVQSNAFTLGTLSVTPNQTSNPVLRKRRKTLPNEYFCEKTALDFSCQRQYLRHPCLETPIDH